MSCCSLLVSEDPNHVRSVACKVFAREVARWQQEHHTLLEEGQTDALFLVKIVDVFLELALVSVTLRYERNYSIYKKERMSRSHNLGGFKDAHYRHSLRHIGSFIAA